MLKRIAIRSDGNITAALFRSSAAARKPSWPSSQLSMSELRTGAIDLVVVLISTSSLVHAAALAQWPYRRNQILARRSAATEPSGMIPMS